MNYLKCKYCGASLALVQNENVIKCSECGNYNTLSNTIDERKASMLDRVNQLRQTKKFDRAISICNQILDAGEPDAEIYWLILLCKYGVYYVVDINGKRMPCLDIDEYKSIFDSEDYKKVLQLADDTQKDIYLNDAKLIDDVATGKVKVIEQVKSDPIVTESEVESINIESETEVTSNTETNIQADVDIDKTQPDKINDEIIDTPKKNRKLPLFALIGGAACILVAAVVVVVSLAVKNATKTVVNNDIGSVNVGESFYFGKYEQDCDTSSKEDIEWIVLKKEDGMAMLITKYGLDSVPYNSESAEITWEKSSIREWLNNDFYKEAFSEEEQSMIPSVDIINGGNPEYTVDPGNNTVDKVFFLDIFEAMDYFESDQSRMALPTDYAISRSAYVHDSVEYSPECAGYTYWWLRSPGDFNEYAAIIDYDGHILYYGLEVEYEKVTVRPVIYLTY